MVKADIQSGIKYNQSIPGRTSLMQVYYSLSLTEFVTKETYLMQRVVQQAVVVTKE